jgi:hypothetical protein
MVIKEHMWRVPHKYLIKVYPIRVLPFHQLLSQQSPLPAPIPPVVTGRKRVLKEIK